MFGVEHEVLEGGNPVEEVSTQCRASVRRGGGSVFYRGKVRYLQAG